QWAISVPVERQTHVAVLADKARAYGFEGHRVDGTDLVAVYTSVRDAAARARAGRGPALLEFVVFRMTAHSSSDDPRRYQPADFLDRARARDPLGRLDRLLRRTGHLTDERAREIAQASESRVREAVQEAEATASPPEASMTADVFSPPAPGAG
ncbi:MAG TPA: thiamine pyrophosphate-dependent enzyme, partial [Thermoplasmata archaeon]|nr:thiamine pyrophosphate-dependent enzyme [Thermoplasmata archaeon]